MVLGTHHKIFTFLKGHFVICKRLLQQYDIAGPMTFGENHFHLEISHARPRHVVLILGCIFDCILPELGAVLFQIAKLLIAVLINYYFSSELAI